MRIDLEKLDENGGRFAEVYQPTQLQFDDEVQLVAPVSVEGRARREKQAAELRGRLRTRVSVACGRCLKRVELPIDVEFDERFVTAIGWRDETQHELAEEELNLSVFDGEGIELDDLVKEEILLALPAQPLCVAECRGLCPVCGADRNGEDCQCAAAQTDSRWDKLKDLRS